MRKPVCLILFKCNFVMFCMLMSIAIFLGLPSRAEIAPLATQLGQEFRDISEKAGAAVVSITTVHVVEARGLGPLERFLERQLPEEFGFEAPEREFRRHGLGSGVIISEDGLILTNSHVVAEAERLTVTLQDEREFTAEIVGMDPPTDIAVLRIDGEDLPTATMGDSDAVATGDFVVAIGNPFGLDHTVTIGNISAMGRADVGIAEYEDFLQIDATINPGNSGGPLVDMTGEVIGINTAILHHAGGGSPGIGFAVPSNMAESVMQSIMEHGKVVRGWLGVSIQDVTPHLAEALDVEYEEGALIGAIMPQSPAEDSNLERGDIIIQINEMEIDDSRELRRYVAGLEPGSEVTVTVVRDGEIREFQIVIAERPVDEPEPQVETPDRLGIQVGELTERARRQLNLEAEQGVLVVEVDPAGAAYAEGIRPGMVIKEVNRQTVDSVEEFNQAMDAAMERERVLFLLSFRGRSIYAAVPTDPIE